jgi:hypothetical protein
MRNRWFLCAPLLAVLIATASGVGAQATLGVSAESPLYDDLEHFRALGLWRGSLAVRPMGRGEICRAVDEIEKRSASLAAADRLRLQRLQQICSGLAERDPASSAEEPRSPDPPARNAPRSVTVPATLLAELAAGVRFRGGPTDLDSVVNLDRRPRRSGAAFLSLDAELAKRVGIQVRLWEDYSRLTPQPSSDWVDNMPADGSSILDDPYARNDRAIVSYNPGWVELRLGREERHWGVGRRGTLFLSQNPFPLDGISLRFETRFLTGVSLFAQTQRGPNPPSLEEGEPYPGDRHTAGDAYFAGHRLEFTPPWPISIGLYEAAVYGGRGIDLAYLNPVGILVAMAQDIANRTDTDDKKILGVDARLDLPPVTVYGEFLLDRLVSRASADEVEVPEISSFAQLAGLRWANPFGWGGSDLDLEYAHLDPQVYFHHDQDIRRAFVTDSESLEDRLLGHWMGPNAEGVYLSLRLPPTRWGEIALEFEQVRWGLLEGRRGVEAGFFGLARDEKRWLYGEIGIERTLAARWERSGWRLPIPGRLATRLIAARIARSGALEGDGWQVELRLDWWCERTIPRL